MATLAQETTTMKFSRLSMIVGAAALACALLATPMLRKADAQTPSNPAPYNVDLGALITNTARAPGTVTTSAQANTNWRGVLCKLLKTAESGSPSTTFSIQGYDAATASYQSIATSGAVTGTTNPGVILVYPGAALTTTPTGWVLNSVPLPRAWRISQTIAGANTTETSKVGCNYLL